MNRGKIKGVRFPFLNYSVEAMNMIADMGFTYDSSLAAVGTEKIWPYTLDHGAVTDCLGQLSICNNPKLKAKGLWEIPLTSLTGKFGIIMYEQ